MPETLRDDTSKKTNFVKDNIDILLGILTWIIAASALILGEFSSFEFFSVEKNLFVIPPIWLASLFLVFYFRKRPARRLWWVWLSAPVALYAWLGTALIIVLWGIGGFAP